MLRPIDPDRIGPAIDLLAEGFPERPRSHWMQAIDRMKAFGGNLQAGVPLGQLLEVDGRNVGIMLTPASVRHEPQGIRPVINIASLYIEPAHSWHAILMFRSATKARNTTFLDLTPTPTVQKMLPALGFRQVSQGVSINLSALAALGSAPTRLVDLAALPPGAVAPAIRELLMSHEPFGCVAVAWRDGERWVPALFKIRNIRGLRSAMLVYCGRASCIRTHLAAVARYLLKKGCLLIVLDLPMSGEVPGIARPGKTPRFVRGHTPDDVIDYCGSELALFH